METRAEFLNKRARVLDAEPGNWYVEVGLLCIEMEDGNLFEELGFRNFTEWLTDAMPRSKSTAREAKTNVRILSQTLHVDQMKGIPRCNLNILAKCSTAVVRDSEIEHMAKNGSEKELIRRLQEKHPEQHFVQRNPFPLAFDEQEESEVQKAIEAVRLIEQTPDATASECIVVICAFFNEMTVKQVEGAKHQETIQ
jgi:hypothetical protein